MSPNRRIFLNIVATYGRSLYALLLGLFSARWVYITLGDTDYGLYGVVGGLTAFIAFINGILATSVSRYYAFSVGRSQRNGFEKEGLEECRQWFNTAIVIHSVVPLLLMAIGYPLGVWAVRNFLAIPVERVDDFVWIFRFTCINCFWTMVSVPFNAMYAAKQYIAELTIYSFVSTTLNFFFLLYMIHHPGDWLLRYGLWTCLLGIIPALIITLRAYVVFPECRFNINYMKSGRHLKDLGKFAGWYSFGLLGNLCRYNTLPILVNKYFGGAQNAALAIANTIAGQTETLSSALRGAFQPALANALGAEDKTRAMSLMYQTCKFGTLLVLIFSIPLCLEIEEVLTLWLKVPPENTAGLAIGVITALVLQKLTTGHFIAINSYGIIAGYQFTVGMCFIATFPIAWILMASGIGGVYAAVYAINITMLAAVVVRILFLKKCLDEPPAQWIKEVLLPVLGTLVISVMTGMISRIFLERSFIRVVFTTLLSESAFLPLAWNFVLNDAEKSFVRGKLMVLGKRFYNG